MKTTKKKVGKKNQAKLINDIIKGVGFGKSLKGKKSKTNIPNRNNIIEEIQNKIYKNIDYSIVIKERKKKLEEVKERLKKDFDGLDAVIDRFIGSITCWYCLPEVMERPLILCFWGMTGNGKTDLLRKFIKYLEFESRSCEITVDTNRELSIKDRLEYSTLKENEPGILILDEIQRGRTIDEDGNEDTESNINDLWSLLSDGKFASHADRKEELLESLLQEKYETVSFPLDEEDMLNPYKRSFYEAKMLKRKLSSSVDVEAIMKMEEKEYNEFIRKEIEKPEFSRIPSYKKLLICVLGNLDGAYEMADDVNTDHDADILHEYSKRINIITIKNTLQDLFKPEQIARFGNNHIIYPSFSKETYKKIITRYLEESFNKIRNTTKLNIEYDISINNVVYENGVYPSQGVRPVHSTISYIISKVPDFLIYAFENKLQSFVVKCINSDLVGAFPNGTELKISIEKDIEKIKEKYDDNSKIVTATHESSHGVLYAALFGVAPAQIVINSADNSCEGYMLPHYGDGSVDYHEKTIQVLLAGYLSEEAFFGKRLKTSGCSADIAMATDTAASMIRSYGMGDKISHQNVPGQTHGNSVYTDLKGSDEKIEKILRAQEKKAKELIAKHIDLIQELSWELFNKNTISVKEFIELAKRFGINCIEKKADESVVSNYLEIFKKRLKKS
jgi:cell division protease FtsH